MALLCIDELTTVFSTATGDVAAVDGVSFAIEQGQTLGLVGESGCGKTMTALSILRLLPQDARIGGGRVVFRDRELTAMSEREMRTLRGREIAMIFQEPMASLNPLFTVEDQVGEPLRAHEGLSWRAARSRVIELLEQVEIPDPEERLSAYPHELSGGMRQRVMIAMALACSPKLLIADEPTTALDVTIQAQILDLLQNLQQRMGMAMLLVTHDLGVVAERADSAAVMYAGKIVEQGPAATVFADPRHPYTQGLLRSLPRGVRTTHPLPAIPGIVPALSDRPSGCRFRDRCDRANPDCASISPALREVGSGHFAACPYS